MNIEYKIKYIINNDHNTIVVARFFDYSESQHEVIDENDPYYDGINIGEFVTIPNRILLATRKYKFATYVKRTNINAWLYDEALRFGNTVVNI